MVNQEVIENIVDFISQNGDRFKVVYYSNGIPQDYPQILVEKAINQKGSLENYFQAYISALNPNKLSITVKKPNGRTSSGRSPVTRVFSIISSEVETSPLIQQNRSMNEPYQSYYEKPNLGNPRTNGLPEQYSFQLEILKRNLEKVETELKDYKKKAEEYKEKYTELKLDFNTQEKMHELDMIKREVSEKNSLPSILKESLPALQGIATEYLNSRNNSSQNSTSQLEGTDGLDERVIGMIESIKHLEGNQISIYFELLVRIGHLKPSELPKIIEQLRQLTPEANQILTNQK